MRRSTSPDFSSTFRMRQGILMVQTPRCRRPSTGPRFSISCSAWATNTLILGHRLSEWCGHAPALEEDHRLANTALDLIGQTQLWLGLAGESRERAAARTILPISETCETSATCCLPSGQTCDYGETLMRQFLFDACTISH
ncbi:hypothetical protein F2981_25065 (plasmid) [Sinorhizobium meliloti]|nr:hypothetical protein [Sinorhizobium meliloti]